MTFILLLLLLLCRVNPRLDTAEEAQVEAIGVVSREGSIKQEG